MNSIQFYFCFSLSLSRLFVIQLKHEIHCTSGHRSIGFKIVQRTKKFEQNPIVLLKIATIKNNVKIKIAENGFSAMLSIENINIETNEPYEQKDIF